RTGKPVPPRTTAAGLISNVLPSTWKTLVPPPPSDTVSALILVPSGIVTPLPRRTRPPRLLEPMLPAMVPSLPTLASRATRNGVSGQLQKNRVVVVDVVVVVTVEEVLGAVVVVVDVVVVVGVAAQPWTRKSTPSLWSVAELPVMIWMV